MGVKGALMSWSWIPSPSLLVAGSPPAACLPAWLLPLQLPLRLLLPHRRLLLRPLLVLLLLPPALCQPPQAAPPPVSQPEQEGDPPLNHLLPQRELDGSAAQHREGNGVFSEGTR